jgi:hypothetical protein
VLGGFVQRLAADVPRPGRRVLAVDGKTARGSRHCDRDDTDIAGRHLLSVIDQHSRVVVGQVAVESKGSEIGRFRPPGSRRRAHGRLVFYPATPT